MNTLWILRVISCVTNFRLVCLLHMRMYFHFLKLRVANFDNVGVTFFMLITEVPNATV